MKVAVMLACDACGSTAIELGQGLCMGCRGVPMARKRALLALLDTLTAMYLEAISGRFDAATTLGQQAMIDGLTAVTEGATGEQLLAMRDVAKVRARLAFGNRPTLPAPPS